MKVKVGDEEKGTAAAEGLEEPGWAEVLEFAVSGEMASNPDEEIVVRVWDHHWVSCCNCWKCCCCCCCCCCVCTTCVVSASEAVLQSFLDPPPVLQNFVLQFVFNFPPVLNVRPVLLIVWP